LRKKYLQVSSNMVRKQQHRVRPGKKKDGGKIVLTEPVPDTAI
jgi:hypothetical protein